MSDSLFLIGALLIAGVWGFYLFPSFFGQRREAPLNSTEEFGRWTHFMADVQQREYGAGQVSARDVVRARRRRTMAILLLLSIGTLVLAYLRSSVNWLLVSLAVDGLIAWYVAMLMQLRQRRALQAARVHARSQPVQADQPRVRIVAGN